jgi:hypothetical protein
MGSLVWLPQYIRHCIKYKNVTTLPQFFSLVSSLVAANIAYFIAELNAGLSNYIFFVCDSLRACSVIG